VVATDSITVGGFGLASVNFQRTVIQDEKPLVPLPQPGDTPAPSDAPSGDGLAGGALGTAPAARPTRSR
jgi:hypothetical protein